MTVAPCFGLANFAAQAVNCSARPAAEAATEKAIIAAAAVRAAFIIFTCIPLSVFYPMLPVPMPGS